jgi:NAD(P)-dependent dehydrogenase (short-subunit alcohol dehydrogenase family)
MLERARWMVERLAGGVAVVTGAASGIGLALAGRLADEGMRLVLADVEVPALEAAGRGLRDRGAEVLEVATDVSVATSVAGLAERAFERFGAVQVLCNNAGVMTVGHTVWEAPASVWEWVLGVNLWGVVHGIRAFLPPMLARNQGHVVNVASSLGLETMPGLGPYSASKHAVVAISEALRDELAARGVGVGVTVACPGLTATGISRSERNWPARLGGCPEDPLSPTARRLVQAHHDAGLAPGEVARLVVEAVRVGRFWALAEPDGLERRVGAIRGRR